MTAAVARRWHLGHAILASLAVVCALLVLRLILADRPALPAMPPLAPPPVGDAALLARHDLFFGVAGAAGDQLPVTSLPFSLHGLRTDAATGRGGAIIAGPDGVQNSHAVGDDLGDGVILLAIAFDHVVLEHDGQREALWLDSSGTAAVDSYDPGDDMPDADAMEPPPPSGMPPRDPMTAPEEPSDAADLPAAPADSESNS